MKDQPLQIKDQRSKTKDQIAAIVLAAGRSRRMGRFKPLLPFGNRTVIETVVANLRTADVEEIVVVVGHQAEAVQRQLKSASVTFVVNQNPDSEMSASIALGVAAITSTAKALLITPVDHPAVPPHIIEQLIEKWGGGAELIQPEFERKGGHPVLIDLSYRDALVNLDPQTGLRGFFERHRAGVLRLPVDTPLVAWDMDTWDDYVRLHQAVFGGKPRETA